MPSNYAQAAINLGGSCNEFVQTDFIRLQGWDNTDKKKRKGAITSGNGLGGGCCMALSAMYLGSRADWSVFKNIIVTPGGLAHIRGFQNLGIHAHKVGTFNPAQTKVYQDIMKIFGVAYGGRSASGGQDAAAGSLGFSRQDGMYYLVYWGDWGGHAVALHRKGQLTKAFDPNFGEATVPIGQFARFVSWWLPGYYPGITSYLIQRYVG